MTTISSSQLPPFVVESAPIPFPPPASSSACAQPHTAITAAVVQTTKLVHERSTRLNQYHLTRTLGKGQHGSVRLATSEADRRTYAIKIVSRLPKTKSLPRGESHSGLVMPRSTASGNLAGAQLGRQISSTENKIRKEIAIMRKCSHQHIVRLYEVIDDPSAKKVYLIMEYCAGGEVKWRTPDNKPKLSLFQIRHILRDISLGLEYLHYQGIIHRDVKPANILYTKNRTMVKLADLGSAHFSYAQRLALAGHDEANLDEPLDQVLMNDKDITRTAGSPAFFSPELCYQGEDLNKPNEQLDPKYRITNAIDIWALGITLFAFLYGDIPWKNVQSEFAIYSVIVEETIVFPSEMGVERITLATEAPDSIASQAHDLLNRMLQKDPSKRATIADIKRHPFISGDLPNVEQWLAETAANRWAKVEVSTQETAGAFTKLGFFRSRISSRRVPGPSHQPSVDQSVATNAPICRNAPKPKKRELLQPQAPQAPPRSGAAQSAIDLSNGARRSRPKLPSLATNRTADSASSHAPSSTSPPSRTASPAKSNSSKVASFMKSLNPLRRRHKSDSTMSTSAPPNGTQASFQPPHAGPSVLQDEPEGDPDALPPLSPSQGSTTEDEDWGEVIDGRHHAPYGHRNSAGSTTSISTRNSGPDLSWGARAIGAGGFEPLDADASSLPSGPSSLATSLPVFQPSPRAASVPLAVLGRVDSWDADGLVPLKPHPVMQTLVPPRTSMSSPLRSEFSLLATHDVEDSPDDHDDRPPSLMRHVPHRNVRPPTPPTQSRNKDRRYNEDDGSDSGSDDEGETDEGHNFVQMRRRPSTSTSTQNSPSTQSSGGQSPATSPPTRALSLGVPVGVGLTHA